MVIPIELKVQIASCLRDLEPQNIMVCIPVQGTLLPEYGSVRTVSEIRITNPLQKYALSPTRIPCLISEPQIPSVVTVLMTSTSEFATSSFKSDLPCKGMYSYNLFAESNGNIGNNFDREVDWTSVYYIDLEARGGLCGVGWSCRTDRHPFSSGRGDITNGLDRESDFVASSRFERPHSDSYPCPYMPRFPCFRYLGFLNNAVLRTIIR